MNDTPETAPHFTDRELEIMRLFATRNAKTGWRYTKKEVADALFVSVRTVDFHVQNVYSKLGEAPTREDAIDAMRELNLL